MYSHQNDDKLNTKMIKPNKPLFHISPRILRAY